MENESSELALRLKRLKLLHFEVIVAVADYGGITAAAAALGRSQPAISQLLAESEHALGVTLFSRGRQIKGTPYLPPVLRYVRRAINDSWQLKRELETIARSGQSMLRLGTMIMTGTDIVPRAIINLREVEASIQLSIIEDTALGLWDRFNRNEIDLIVGRLDERAFSKDYEAQPLYKDPYCIVVNNQHPLLKLNNPRWEDTEDYPWVLPAIDTGLRRAIDVTFLAHSLRPPTPWVESASPSVNLALVRQTFCLNIMSYSAAEQHLNLGLCSVLPLTLKYDVGPIGVVWSARRLSPALKSVLNSLRLAAKQKNNHFDQTWSDDNSIMEEDF